MRKILISSIFILILINSFLYYIDRPDDDNSEFYRSMLQKKNYSADYAADEFTIIDRAFTDKNLESNWIYTIKSDSLWFKRIRVPSTYSLSKYNLFFQKILRENCIDLIKAEEYELSNKLVFSFNTLDSVPASVELRLVHNMESGLKLSGNVSLVVHGMGDSWGQEWIKEFFTLPIECAFSIIPGRWATDNLYKEALKNNKTVLINLPMEPEKGNIEKEKYRLLKGMNSFSIDVVLERSLSEMPGAAGIMNYRGGRVIADFETMDIFLKAVRERKMVYVERFDGMYSYSELIADDIGMPFMHGHFCIDSAQDIEEKTDKVIERVNEGEDILMMILASEENYKKLKSILPEKFAGIDFISLNQLAGR
ncbi:MAG: divergent polysaccharide deacetylase family protein [Candidatus Delongbacteria bacterium]|nr:divergent polysaccharide deacetylase family protein [Candidatus Delongbacteria bacterium]